MLEIDGEREDVGALASASLRPSSRLRRSGAASRHCGAGRPCRPSCQYPIAACGRHSEAPRETAAASPRRRQPVQHLACRIGKRNDGRSNQCGIEILRLARTIEGADAGKSSQSRASGVEKANEDNGQGDVEQQMKIGDLPRRARSPGSESPRQPGSSRGMATNNRSPHDQIAAKRRLAEVLVPAARYCGMTLPRLAPSTSARARRQRDNACAASAMTSSTIATAE